MTKKLDELDDAALGKRLRKEIQAIEDAAKQLDITTINAAAMLLCNFAAKNNAAKFDMNYKELSLKGVDIGDWQVKIIKVKS